MVGADLTDFLGYVLLCGEGGCITHTEKRAQIIRIQLDERTPDTENAVTSPKFHGLEHWLSMCGPQTSNMEVGLR